jgi:hypothetical protein
VPYHHSVGEVPHKRHTPFRRSDGRLALASEDEAYPWSWARALSPQEEQKT